MKLTGRSRSCVGATFHAGGEQDHWDAMGYDGEYAMVREKIWHRFDVWCRPRSLVGCFRLSLRRARLLRRLKKRYFRGGSCCY